ncbi:hypothetical protein NQZ68_015894 [Dissostichus eleginoides]|nr:hypothetical protein NQZ68_015894 [Dissostichus eleginoides]
MMPLGLARRNSPEQRVMAVFRPQYQLKNRPQLDQTPTEDQTPTLPQTPTPSASTTPQRVALGKRKRGGEETLTILREMNTADLAQQERNQERHLAHQDRHLQLTLEAAARAREVEVALRREENAQAGILFR